MARLPNMANRENVCLADLGVAAKAFPRQRGFFRMSAIRALCLGYTDDQVDELYGGSRRTVSRWVRWFNERGVDGLVDRARPGRPRKISPEKGAEYRDLIQHPEKAKEIHWPDKKFHGYVTKKLDDEVGYRTVLRWLHDERFRLKVPRSWPNGQDGDPRPRRRWALRGEKTVVPYEGTHVRMTITGMVCPRTGEFYALMFNHTDTQVMQVFLDHANQDIHRERKRNILICDNASWHKSASLNWGNFERVFLPPYWPISIP